MPFKWIPPKVFTRYRGIKVYYTYNDGSIYNPSEYWYGLDVEEDWEDSSFDIRSLAEECGVSNNFDPHKPCDVKRVIRKAMTEGRLLRYMPPDVAYTYDEEFGPFGLDGADNDHSS